MGPRTFQQQKIYGNKGTQTKPSGGGEMRRLGAVGIPELENTGDSQRTTRKTVRKKAGRSKQ